MENINHYVMSTWDEKKQKWVDIESFGTYIAAKLEYFYTVGQQTYDNLVLIDVAKGKKINQWKKKNK